MNKVDILEFLREHKGELQTKFGVKRIGIFGSYARGEAREASDIDIIVELEKKDFFIRCELRDYLQRSLNKSVDIGYLDSFRELIREEVQKDLLYAQKIN